MPDDVARAVAAGGRTITIAGKQCQVRPLGIRELTEVERDCLQRYKRQYLETFQANLDLLPEEDRGRTMDRKMEEAARWDVDDLPSKWAYDPRTLKITAELISWLTENMGVKAPEKDKDENDQMLRRTLATALDQGSLDENEYQKLSGGHKPIKAKVPYVNWWITGCFDGMISFIWTCFRRDGITREQVVEELGGNMGLLSDVSREIEHLSAPAVGNG